MAARLYLGDTIVDVASVYIPPAVNFNKEQLDQLVAQLGKRYILMGDLNGHHELWGSPENDLRGTKITGWLNDKGLAVLSTGEPTFLSNLGTFILTDLTIDTHNILRTVNWQPLCDLMDSDHFPIVIQVFNNIQSENRSNR